MYICTLTLGDSILRERVSWIKKEEAREFFSQLDQVNAK
jgi:hypothetical protein